MVTKKKWNIRVDKQWEGKQLDSVEIELLRDGAVVQTASVGASDSWTHTFYNLPVKDDSGRRYRYTVREKEVAGYETNITGNPNDGFVIRNREVLSKGEKTGNTNTAGKLPRTGEARQRIVKLFALLLLGLLGWFFGKTILLPGDTEKRA